MGAAEIGEMEHDVTGMMTTASVADVMMNVMGEMGAEMTMIDGVSVETTIVGMTTTIDGATAMSVGMVSATKSGVAAGPIPRANSVAVEAAYNEKLFIFLLAFVQGCYCAFSVFHASVREYKKRATIFYKALSYFIYFKTIQIQLFGVY
jgi:hypothetical protein